MITQSVYDEYWKLYTEGKVTEEEWKEFCTALLNEYMAENRAILIRLKERHPP